MKTIVDSFLRSLLIMGLWILVNPVAVAQIGTCEEPTGQAILEAGNIRARIYNNGALFWNGGRNLYEAPKNSGVNSIFASTFNVGGLINGRLHMTSSTYGPFEFWPGPLDANGIPPADCSIYDQIWEIHSEDFKQFEADGTFSFNMLSWPWQLGAPVEDGDGNPDNYNLEGGDRPELLGDQMLWWIMNDRGNEHRWSKVEPIGLEVRVSAFAFENARTGGDITFYRYLITNKNSVDLTDAFISMWLDPDLGNAADDYIGSDSLLHLGYVYNGDPLDENGYEDQPPAAGFTFLITPEAQIDALDNDYDGEVDEPGEPAGMYSAMTYHGGGGVVGDPGNGSQMYTYMRGLWIDNQPMTEGGSIGRDFSSKPTRFVFPGDPSTQSYWTELRPDPNGLLLPNTPSDRRYMTSSGPFTLPSGASTEFLTALVWAQGSNHLDSVRKLKGIVASMQTIPASFLTSGYQQGNLESPPPEPQHVLGFNQNFPNPFTSTTSLRYSLPKMMQVRLAVYDILGREVAVLTEGTQEAGIYTLDFDGTDLPPGIYYARIELDHLSYMKKMIRIP